MLLVSDTARVRHFSDFTRAGAHVMQENTRDLCRGTDDAILGGGGGLSCDPLPVPLMSEVEIDQVIQ